MSWADLILEHLTSSGDKRLKYRYFPNGSSVPEAVLTFEISNVGYRESIRLEIAV